MRAPSSGLLPRDTRSARARRRSGALVALASASILVAACGWDPKKPFDRESPAVKQAIVDLDGGDASTAATTLEDYLLTGQCKEGSIGTPPLLRQRANGGFDLGLALFKVGEAFGRRFGDEEVDPEKGAGAHGPSPARDGEDDVRQRRAAQIGCALQVVQALASDESQPVDLRARARYLEGNVHFLGTDYEAAVSAYDHALALAPGMVDAGDPIGRDAAWNRAIALRRIDDKKDAGNDGGSDASGDGASDASQNGDSGPRDGGGKNGDSGDDKHDASDSGDDAGAPPKPPADAGPPPPAKGNQDERILDQLENAPTVQQEDARKHAQKHRVRGSDDK